MFENRLRVDGGVVPEKAVKDSRQLDASEHDECDCDDLHDVFSCPACYIDGRERFAE